MSLAPLTGHYSPRSTAYSPPQTKIPSLNSLDSLSGLLDGGASFVAPAVPDSHLTQAATPAAALRVQGAGSRLIWA
jgi:hypothetical protein